MSINIDKLFNFFSSKTKRYIIMHLYLCSCSNCCVEKICNILDLKQANMSKHLIDLKKWGIVKFKKDGHKIIYFLEEEFAKKYLELLNFIKMNENHKCNCKNG